MLLNKFGNVVIEESRNVQAIVRLRPIRKHDGHGANDLNARPERIIFLDSKFRIPGVLLDFPKKLVAAHHFGVAPLVVLQIDKVAISELLRPVGQLSWQDVRVTINFEHRRVGRENDIAKMSQKQLTKNSSGMDEPLVHEAAAESPQRPFLEYARRCVLELVRFRVLLKRLNDKTYITASTIICVSVTLSQVFC